MRQIERVPRVHDRVSAAAVALCLAELCLVAVAIWVTFAYQSTVTDRNHGRKTLAALDSATIGLLDAETGQRGYLITGEERFLAPYEEGQARLDAALSELLGLVQDEPDWVVQQHALASLAGQKRAELQQTLSARQRGDSPAEIASLLTNGTGKELMDEFRERRRSMTAEVADRVAGTESRADRLAVISIGSAAALALLTIGVVALLGFSVRRRAEAEGLRRAAAAKDEFVGFVSHELRGPIALIAGNARYILDHAAGEDAERTSSAGEIARSAERLEAIVATLLSLAKAESGGQLPVEPVLAQRVVERVLSHHKALFPDRQLTLITSPNVPAVMADRDAVEQVLVNLLQNAERYGDASAPIRVEIVEQPAASVTISVLNAGLVLDDAQFSRVFEPFFRMRSSATAAGGIGLGLTVCHRLIAAQGGAMFAEPQHGGGARFSFRLPIAEDPPL